MISAVRGFIDYKVENFNLHREVKIGGLAALGLFTATYLSVESFAPLLRKRNKVKVIIALALTFIGIPSTLGVFGAIKGEQWLVNKGKRFLPPICRIVCIVAWGVIFGQIFVEAGKRLIGSKSGLDTADNTPMKSKSEYPPSDSESE